MAADFLSVTRAGAGEHDTLADVARSASGLGTTADSRPRMFTRQLLDFRGHAIRRLEQVAARPMYRGNLFAHGEIPFGPIAVNFCAWPLDSSVCGRIRIGLACAPLRCRHLTISTVCAALPSFPHPHSAGTDDRDTAGHGPG